MVDTLWLSLFDNVAGTVYDVRHLESSREFMNDTKCWLYLLVGSELRDSEACEVP